MAECFYPHCRNEVKYLPIEQLPLCEEHYYLHRFIQDIFLMTKWEPKWKDWALQSSETSTRDEDGS